MEKQNEEQEVSVKTMNGADGDVAEVHLPADFEQRIIEQVEYYFGDISLPRDRFMLEEMKKDDGWISMMTMMKFNRLKCLCPDPEVIVKALKKSESGLVEVAEDGLKIRRSMEHQLPENSLEYWEEVKSRTVYVKGFDPVTTTLDELKTFFAQFGCVKNVLMRRIKSADRIFKGSVFVTYADQATCKLFVDNDVTEYKAQPLVKLMQMDYWKQKNEREKDKRKQEKEAKAARRNINPPVKDTTFVKGQVARLSGLPADGISVDLIKQVLSPHGSVAYVTYEKGDKTTLVRFWKGEKGENGAESILEKARAAADDGKLRIGGQELSWVVLEGQEETDYWNAYALRKARTNTARKGKRKGDTVTVDARHDNKQSRREPKVKKIVFKDSDEEQVNEGHQSIDNEKADAAFSS